MDEYSVGFVSHYPVDTSLDITLKAGSYSVIVTAIEGNNFDRLDSNKTIGGAIVSSNEVLTLDVALDGTCTASFSSASMNPVTINQSEVRLIKEVTAVGQMTDHMPGFLRSKGFSGVLAADFANPLDYVSGGVDASLSQPSVTVPVDYNSESNFSSSSMDLSNTGLKSKCTFFQRPSITAFICNRTLVFGEGSVRPLVDGDLVAKVLQPVTIVARDVGGVANNTFSITGHIVRQDLLSSFVVKRSYFDLDPGSFSMNVLENPIKNDTHDAMALLTSFGSGLILGRFG